MHDHVALKAGLAMLLDSVDGFAVTELVDAHGGPAGGGPERPDVVLIVVEPGTPAPLLARQQLSAQPAAVALMYTGTPSGGEIEEALQLGVRALLLAADPTDAVVAAVRSLAAGHAWLSPPIARQLVDRVRSAQPPGVAADHGLAVLSDRERGVVRLIAAGMSNGEIASELQISESTVKTHVSRLLGKLGVRDRVQAALLVRRSTRPLELHPDDSEQVRTSPPDGRRNSFS